MANFEASVAFVLKHEGGYVNHPDDPGGETKFGISKRAYPQTDIANLTEAAAKAIYERDYWRASGADAIGDNYLALIHFDTAVNMGVGRAKALLEASHGDAKDYLMRRLAHYAEIVRKKPRLASFLNGWVNRVVDCYKTEI